MFGTLWWKRLGELVVVAVVVAASLVATTIVEELSRSVSRLGAQDDPGSKP